MLVDKVHQGSVKVGTVISLSFWENEKYKVNAVLKGGMGEVYQLVPVRPGLPVALKTLTNANRAAFERECEIWLSLGSHPNVAHACAFGYWSGKPAIVVEWYDGTLADANFP